MGRNSNTDNIFKSIKNGIISRLEKPHISFGNLTHRRANRIVSVGTEDTTYVVQIFFKDVTAIQNESLIIDWQTEHASLDCFQLNLKCLKFTIGLAL